MYFAIGNLFEERITKLLLYNVEQYDVAGRSLAIGANKRRIANG